MVLDAAGYGPMARLEGIYRCDYTEGKFTFEPAEAAAPAAE